MKLSMQRSMTRSIKRYAVSTALALCAAGALFSSTALAQEESTPPPAPSSPPPAASSSSSGGGSRGEIGVGAIAYLTPGVTGLSVAYDPGAWHIDTMIGLDGGRGNGSAFQIGGRFWYHLQQSNNADLSAGAGLAYGHFSQNMASSNTMSIEIGGMIRVFLADRVALGTAAGMAFGTLDADGYTIGLGNLVGSAAIHYFF